MAFKPVVEPYETRPKAQHARPDRRRQTLYALREHFSVSTWLLLGAVLQSAAILVVPRAYLFLALLPPVVLLLVRLTDTIAITKGWKANPYLEGASLFRTAAQVPNEDGVFHSEASEEKITVFMLGAKVNHPLGTFSPHAKLMADYLGAMLAELNDAGTALGWYGGSSWTNQDEKGATEYLNLSYWRSPEDIHKFAYGPRHRNAWDWWNRTLKELDHIGINHEIFEVDRKHWESLYINFQPTLLGATTYLRKGDKLIGGKVDDQWISPLVDASKGKLRSSAGRLGRDPTELYDKLGTAPGASYED